MAYFDGVNQENYQSWQEATRKNAMFRPLVEMTNAIGTAVLIWYGATLIMNETITIGVFVSLPSIWACFGNLSRDWARSITSC